MGDVDPSGLQIKRSQRNENQPLHYRRCRAGHATAVQAAQSVPGSVGTQPAAPIQQYGASPGMPGSSVSPNQPSYGALPGQPGSPT